MSLATLAKVLEQFDDETSCQMIDNAYAYLLDKKSVPIKKLALNVRVAFSAIYEFLRTQPQKTVQYFDASEVRRQSTVVGRASTTNKKVTELDGGADLAPQVLMCLKEKIYLLYGQSYSKVGLLSNYKVAIH